MIARRSAAAGLLRRPGARSMGSYAPSGSSLTRPATSLYAAWDARASVTEISGGVSSWLDSVSSIDLTQSTASKRPSTGVASIGGNNALRFDGTDDALITSGLGSIGGQLTIHLVAALVSTGSGQQLIDIRAGTSDRLQIRTSTTTILVIGDVSDSVAITYDTSPHLYSFVIDGSGGTCTIYVDGSSIGSCSADNDSLGTALGLASNYVGSSVFCQMDVGDLSIYSVAQDATAVSGVYAYASQEWGV